jgi:hypothetical protein
VVSLVTGALSYLLIFFHSLINMSFLVSAILAPITAIAAIITGHSSKKQIRNAGGEMAGKKMANAGLILGYIYLAICILLLVLAILGLSPIISGLGGLFK